MIIITFNYFNYRLKDTHLEGQAWTESAKELQRYLLQNVRHLKPIEQAYQDVLSGLLSPTETQIDTTSLSLPSQFSTFASNLQGYANYATSTIEPLILVTLQQESNRVSCSATQQAVNKSVQIAISSFNSSISQVTDQVRRNIVMF